MDLLPPQQSSGSADAAACDVQEMPQRREFTPAEQEAWETIALACAVVIINNNTLITAAAFLEEDDSEAFDIELMQAQTEKIIAETELLKLHVRRKELQLQAQLQQLQHMQQQAAAAGYRVPPPFMSLVAWPPLLQQPALAPQVLPAAAEGDAEANARR